MAKRRQDDIVGNVRTLFDIGTLGGLTDEQLLSLFTAAGGETAELAFAALVERHGAMALRVGRALLRNEHEAQDVSQATFLVLARKAPSLRIRDSLGPWLHAVACRVAACARSEATRRRRIERRVAEMAERSVADWQADDLEAAIHEEVDRLPERFRRPVILCYLEGMTGEQAARLLGWPVGTVRSRLARARERLRWRLIRRGLAPTAGGLTAALARETPAAALPPALTRSIILNAPQFGVGIVAVGSVSTGIVFLAKGALSAMRVSRIRQSTLAVLAAALTVGGVRMIAARAEDPRPALLTSASPITRETIVAIPFMDVDRREFASSPFPNPYQPNGMKIGEPPGSLTLRLGPVRFDDRRLPFKGMMPLIETDTIIALTGSNRDRVVAYSTERGRSQGYRVPDGVVFSPVASERALALYLSGESIPEVAVFSARSGAWTKQTLKAPARGKLEPMITPDVVLYGAGRWVYAYSTRTDSWDVLELPQGEEMRAHLSGPNVLIGDDRTRKIHVFAPRVGRWDTIETSSDPSTLE